MDDDGSAKELDGKTGHKVWETKVGTLAAASPALGVKQGLMYLPVLSAHGHSPGDGRFVALSMKTGRIVWSKVIPAGTESSPIAVGNAVYFGDQGGNVYSLNATHGSRELDLSRERRRQGRAGARRTASCTSATTPGAPTRVNAASGHLVWARNTNGADFGFGSGNFYSTPAVAFGRVYMGNTDGRVYSFAAKTGKLAWATGTGAYVYASAAVDDTPGLGPTVYLGSYDGNFYAFDAQSGAIRWRHPAGGKISGIGHDRRQRRLLLGPRHEDHGRPRRAHRPAGVLIPRRGVQPGRRRQRRDLPERVHDALPDAAQASLNARSPRKR